MSRAGLVFHRNPEICRPIISMAQTGVCSALVGDEHTKICHELPRSQIEVGVGNRADIHDVFLADLAQKIRDLVVKAVTANFDAIRASDGFDAQPLIGDLGGNFQWHAGLFDQDFAWRVMCGYSEVLFLFGRCGGCHGVNDMRRVSDIGDYDGVAASRAFDLAADTAVIHH